MWRSWVLLKSPSCSTKVLTCPGKQFSFQNVRNVTLAVQFHSWGYKNEWISPSGCDCRPYQHRKWILASAFTPAFYWSISDLKSNFFSSVNSKLGTVPSFMRFRMCWHLSSLIRSSVVRSYVHEWRFDALKFDWFLLLQPFLQQNEVNSFSTFPSYFSDCSFSALAWSVACFTSFRELFNYLPNSFSVNMQLFRDARITLTFFMEGYDFFSINSH